ncbi:MAG: Glycosyl transferase group 1 [Parcubacteria group bacterium GW2011_GWA2_40_8]|nr:MAG: Glycosyl transferase group 1 [Parcubacteria group bacterium GW2011_GWB1_40_14]KKR78217.1 MAG: Glycosyl transferase group 1 [Parcubacteria group bacterium GW2011_GWA2_40_8]
MRVALVHDYLTQYGGAERVLEALCDIFPQAPIFTLIYDERGTKGVFKERRIVTSFLQNFEFVKKHHRLFPPLMPIAVEQFDLSAYQVVISDSASFAKGIITRPESKHICYCHTPTRFAWDDSHRYVEEFGGYPLIMRKLAPIFLNWLRIWDHSASLRPDTFIANSYHVQNRIRKYYGRDAEVIFPPVKVDYFSKGKRDEQDFFLMAGRLIAYKRFDLGIEAARRAGFNLHIVGDGPAKKQLKQLAQGAPNIRFLGAVSDEVLREEYSRCQAMIFPQEEDFGLVAVEAMAAGSPVIAWRGGGALETVQDGKTGMFFEEQTVESLEKALQKFNNNDFSTEYIKEHARNFDTTIFNQKIKNFIDKQLI